MIRILKDVHSLFGKGENTRFFKVLILSFFGAIFETISVGVLFPLSTAISNPENKKHLQLLNKIGLENLSTNYIFLYGMIIILVLYFLKSTYLSVLTWTQMGFLYKNQALFSQNLFSKYLTKNYQFHLNRNSSDLIRNIITETNVYLTYFLQSGMTLLTESMVVLFIIILLIVIEPISAVFISSVFLFGIWIFNRFFGKRVSNWGNDRQLVEGERMRVLKEGLGSIKEVIVFSRAEYYFNIFKKADDINAILARKQSTLMQLPRIWLEFFALLSICTMSIIMLKMGRTIPDILAVLVIYAASAFRLLPSFSRIMGAIQSIKYSLPVLKMFKSDVVSLKNKFEFDHEKSEIQFENKIQFINIDFRYSENERGVIENINFSIERGEIIGLVGKSAAGKSTLVDIFLGLLKPTNGKILIDGSDMRTFLKSWQNIIGYIPQNVYLSDKNLLSNIAFGIPENEIELDKVITAVKLANLESFLENNNFELYQNIGENGVRLSGGQRQRIGIARALYHNPQILVLDEATSALDSITEKDILKSIFKFRGDKTIVIISHKEHTLEDCDMIYQIKNGQLTQKN